MATNSNIEWTDCTWNPVIGCRHVAEGCRHCYAETMSKRLAAMGQRDYASILTQEGKFNGRAITRPDTLAEPLRWRKPRMVFVNSMSDLFHEDVPFEFIATVFGVMAACPQHTFQVLTKRPERAREFFEWVQSKADGYESVANTAGEFIAMQAIENQDRASTPWPLKNVWLGVSIAHQPDADALIPILLKCPAAVRFVSAEPLIGGVQFRPQWLEGTDDDSYDDEPGECEPPLNWVIVGGESGHNARPCDIAWIRSIVEQCKAATVACFVKQLGAEPYIDYGGRALGHPMHSPDSYTSWDKVSSSKPSILQLDDRKGGDPSEWPEDLRVREFPQVTT